PLSSCCAVSETSTSQLSPGLKPATPLMKSVVRLSAQPPALSAPRRQTETKLRAEKSFLGRMLGGSFAGPSTAASLHAEVKGTRRGGVGPIFHLFGRSFQWLPVARRRRFTYIITRPACFASAFPG